MSRIVERPIQSIQTNDRGEPVAWLDRGVTHRVVEILDAWREAGNWWEDEPNRAMYRVLTSENYVYDLEESEGKWKVYKVWD
ncbi:DUF6504 family protein [Alicyclobacillus shizuokensis]|uniref:DUF6504 family protein n=1 Tax=Alicyclobacillus shizuokensis TaxID=392014 RepID=UPI000833021D|nr:DUF6504 family protein [Alicyclobacillus shizuokensis]